VKTIEWNDEVAADYRSRIILDPGNPILACRANSYRYIQSERPGFAGLPRLGSRCSSDALLWNVFRSMQKARLLHIICNMLEIGKPRSMLVWGLSPRIDAVGTELQYIVGTLVRSIDGGFPESLAFPDIILLGSEGVAVIECGLPGEDLPASLLWRMPPDYSAERLSFYLGIEPRLIEKPVNNDDTTEVFRLVRSAFFGLQLATKLDAEAVIAAIAPLAAWQKKPRDSVLPGWLRFNRTVNHEALRKIRLSWQDIRTSISGRVPLGDLIKYLDSHPCL
jgi:hypothetical protein